MIWISYKKILIYEVDELSLRKLWVLFSEVCVVNFWKALTQDGGCGLITWKKSSLNFPHIGLRVNFEHSKQIVVYVFSQLQHDKKAYWFHIFKQRNFWERTRHILLSTFSEFLTWKRKIKISITMQFKFPNFVASSF